MAFHPLDLRLPQDKTPNSVSSVTGTPLPVSRLIPNYAVGSSSDRRLVYQNERGLFGCVYESWKNHWNLRTSPEDWWMPVATKVAKAIDKAAQREDKIKNKEKTVRKLFVNHKEKKDLCVDVDVFTIYQIDYENFFDQMSGMMRDNINNAEFASVMQNDFSTSEPTHKISSQVNLMASMQQFFNYGMWLCGCGIKGVEMLGTQADWDALRTKFHRLREILKPIKKELGHRDFDDEWFDHVEMVYTNLAKTYSETQSGESASEEIADFWMKILMEGVGIKYGPSGVGKVEVKAYNGWIIRFLLNSMDIHTEDLFDSDTIAKLNGLNDVPLTITMKYTDPPISDKSTLVSGMIGFELHTDDTFNGVPSVQPHHMWAMQLPEDSPLRRN